MKVGKMVSEKFSAIALALFGLFLVAMLCLNPNPGWFFLIGIYWCFTISIELYAFNRKVDGKKAGTIFTSLLSLWIGGYCFFLGIQDWPSMGGQMLVYTGIFCFVVIWVVYGIIKLFNNILRNWSAKRKNQKRDK